MFLAIGVAGGSTWLYEGILARNVFRDYRGRVKPREADLSAQETTLELAAAVKFPSLSEQTWRRESDFTMSPDGVHVNHEGHTVLAQAILDAWGYPAREVPPDLLALVVERQKLMHDAWLSHVGHKRPGMKAGLPIDEARKRSQLIQQRIDDRLSRTR